MFRLLVVLLLAIFLVNQVNAASNITGTVSSVLDGDTIKIGDKKIRLILIDAPEMGTRSTADDAKAYVKEHCYNKKAFVDVNDKEPKDSSGRYLGLVFCNSENQSMNEQSLALDYSVLYRYFACNADKNEFTNLSFVKC